MCCGQNLASTAGGGFDTRLCSVSGFDCNVGLWLRLPPGECPPPPPSRCLGLGWHWTGRSSGLWRYSSSARGGKGAVHSLLLLLPCGRAPPPTVSPGHNAVDSAWRGPGSTVTCSRPRLSVIVVPKSAFRHSPQRLSPAPSRANPNETERDVKARRIDIQRVYFVVPARARTQIRQRSDSVWLASSAACERNYKLREARTAAQRHHDDKKLC